MHSSDLTWCPQSFKDTFFEYKTGKLWFTVELKMDTGGWNLFFLPQISYPYHKFNCLKLSIKEIVEQPSWSAVCPINFTVCFRELLYFSALGCCRVVISWVSSVVLAGISTSCWCWNNKDYKENVEMCFKQFLWMLTERQFRVWSCLECLYRG